MLRTYGEDAAIYAGGTELLVVMKERLAHFAHLVSIKTIPGLDGIGVEDARGMLSIGPLATHRSLECSALLRDRAPVFADMEANVANVRVRHAGTIGGNLCFAEPHSDPATLLVAWDAVLTLTSAESEREVAARHFFVDMLETARSHDELLTNISFPLLPASAGSAYERFKTHERPMATAATVLWLNEDNGSIDDSRIVVGSVGPVPQRIDAAERLLRGERPSAEIFRESARVAATDAALLDDLFESADYKRHLVEVMTNRALHQAVERARRNDHAN
jgi:aerobic carbon-monoxide dehydrogenase medium subunit